MIITGTSHFVSYIAALRYYRACLGERPRSTNRKKDDENRRIVMAKIDAGEIHIGPPKLKPGEKLSINTEEGRYVITTP